MHVQAQGVLQDHPDVKWQMMESKMGWTNQNQAPNDALGET